MSGVFKYWSVWKTTCGLSVQTSLENRLSVIFFSVGKLIRFILFIGFILLLGSQVSSVQGYSTEQLIIFFLVFNLFDLCGQFFYRGVYFFRQQVISGELDFRLTKPMSPLFQVLTRHTDILDLPLLMVVILMCLRFDWHYSLGQLLSIVVVFICGFVLITAIHIFVVGLGLLTTEVDNSIMIYRELSQMARFPVDIYHQLVRGFLTFVVPIAIAYTLPAKSILGLVQPVAVLATALTSCAFLVLSLHFWRYALKQYSSASS